MITHQQAERIAAAVSMLRTDWLSSSIVTLIMRDLVNWPLIDVACGLTYVALDRGVDGQLVSKTPARVKEQGPWRHIGNTADPRPDSEPVRQRLRIEAEQRRAEFDEKRRAMSACTLCDAEGRLPTGAGCHHDAASNERIAELVALTRRNIRATGGVSG